MGPSGLLRSRRR